MTSDKYTCNPDLTTVATAQGAVCQPGNKQYDQLAGGNKDLKPEKSLQGTLGLRIEPTSDLSMGVDFWHVSIRDAFGQLTEQQVFANPLQYSTSWGSKRDTGTGVNYLAFLADNRNLGKSYTTGLDFDVSGRTRTDIGDWNSKLAVTYMIRNRSQLEKDGPFYSDIGNFAELGTVTFRWQGNWANTVKTGNWSNSLVLNFKSGYVDQETTADVLDANGNVTGTEDIRLLVHRHFTWDWQTEYAARKDLIFTFGVLNLVDTKPPLAISTGGTNRGQQFGYDDRYYDSRGRTLYANVSYKF